MSLSVWVRGNLSGLIHPRVRSLILRHVSLLDKRTEWWLSKDPFRDDAPHSTYDSRYPVKLGIVKEFWHRHWPYIAACRDLGVAYELVDISRPDWIEVVKASNCDAFLVWPSVQLSIWKQMYDERLRVMVDDLAKVIYPAYDELWLYENKRRMAYWLEANDVPHAGTQIFYDRDEALSFAKQASLPLVTKTAMGARASGVIVHRDRRSLLKYINRAFAKGIVHKDGEARDADWRFVVVQEYLGEVNEWRVIRIGDSFFAHQKDRRGEFHSGTQLKVWGRPSDAILDLAYRITESHGFRSMDLDLFEDKHGTLYVNELQALFGASLSYQMKVEDRIGRLMRDNQGHWVFEEGDFCVNQCANLRVHALLDQVFSRRGSIENPVRS